jgi:Lrp/AsnC family transcriptional regulator
VLEADQADGGNRRHPRAVAVLDADKLGLPVSVFVSVETSDHSAEWLARFADTVAGTPEIVGAWRMSGDVDYLLHVIVPDIAAYDAFYRKLIAAVPLRNVSSRFAMERMKDGIADLDFCARGEERCD